MDMLKVDENGLVELLRGKGYYPCYTLPCVYGKTVWLYQDCTEIDLEIKKYHSKFQKWAKKIRGLIS